MGTFSGYGYFIQKPEITTQKIFVINENDYVSPKVNFQLKTCNLFNFRSVYENIIRSDKY